MAIKLRLSEADRERLGLPEWIEWDASQVMLTEAEALQGELGMDPWDLADALAGTPVLDAAGEPVIVDGRPKVRRNWKAWRYVVWIAARRVGNTSSLADFDLNVLGLRVQPADEPGAADDPKDPSIPESGSDAESDPSAS